MDAPETRPLIVLEMANNHMGDVSHGVSLIDALCAEPFRSHFDFAIKYQFRDLDTFIHPDFKGSDLKFVKRFENMLSKKQWDELISQSQRGLLLIITPFDEGSVDKVLSYDVDFIKIASCSLADWPLLERIAKAEHHLFSNRYPSYPIDNMVSFLRTVISTCQIHCVGLYPTPFDQLNIGQVAF